MKKIIILLVIASFAFAFPALNAVAQTSTTSQPCGDSYIVRSGDTLREIAQKCRVELNDILEMNPFIEDRDLIYAGWVLDMTKTEKTPVVIPETGAATISNAFYVVKSGDSLDYIANRLDLDEMDLLASNPQIDANADLYTGQILLLPGAGEEPAAAVSPRVVEPGQIVTIAVLGFEEKSEVLIAGGPLGEVEKTQEVLKVNSDGALRTTILVPMNAERGKRWTFIVRSTEEDEVQARTNLLYVVDTTGPNDSIVYNVRLNDTLSGIAVKFGVTLEEILDVNPQINNRSIVYVGQDILIPGPEQRDDEEN